jgi:hypothetical protein
MKKLFTCVLLFAVIAGAKAQDQSRQNAVKINPLSLFLATGNVSYERAISEKSSLQLGVFYSGVNISGLKYSGFGITPEYRIYVAGRQEAMNGLYVGPFLRYQSFSLKDKNTSDEASFKSFGGGALLGWEKTWDSGFVLDLFAGPAYNSGKVKSDSGNESEFNVSAGISGFGVRTGITLGFAF